MKDQRAENHSRNVRSQENIDFVSASVVEKPKTVISRQHVGPAEITSWLIWIWMICGFNRMKLHFILPIQLLKQKCKIHTMWLMLFIKRVDLRSCEKWSFIWWCFSRLNAIICTFILNKRKLLEVSCLFY